MNSLRKKFCDGVVVGLSQQAAYAAAYPKASLSTARKNASHLMTRKDIQEEIARMRSAADLIAGSAVLTLIEKRKALAAIVRAAPKEAGPEHPLAVLVMGKEGPYYTFPDKLAAIRLDNDLAGEGAPKVEITIKRAWVRESEPVPPLQLRN